MQRSVHPWPFWSQGHDGRTVGKSSWLKFSIVKVRTSLKGDGDRCARRSQVHASVTRNRSARMASRF
eukprot:6211352-Amphidinium_carterae.1